MGANTKIEWCDHSWNPWVGCTKVSPACDHCYAEGWAKRSGLVTWGPDAERRKTSDANWKLPLKWNADAAKLGVRYRVFCASLADVFDNAVPVQWRISLIKLICETPHLDWLLLTKRIGNAAEMLETAFRAVHHQRDGWADNFLPNVWLGATVCDQTEADRDIPKLLSVPAAKRFLSIEPMLGPVDLTQLSLSIFAAKANALTGKWNWQDGPRKRETPPLDWVIAGGESGPGARPMHPDWVTSLRDQCAKTGTQFMFKQWGEWKPICQMEEAEHSTLNKPRRKARASQDQDLLNEVYGTVCTVERTVLHFDGSTHGITEPMAYLQGTSPMLCFKLGKNAAGRILDGREWNESPMALVARTDIAAK